MSGDPRPDSPEATPAADLLPGLQRAVDHLKAGRREEAERQAERILALRPRDPSALNILGVVRLQTGRHPEAVALFRRALEAQPRNPWIHFNLAEALRHSGAVVASLRPYEAATRLKPDFADAHAHRGEALRALRRWGAAATAYRLALQHEPRLASALNGVGRLLQEAGAPDQAARHFEAAVAAPPVGEAASVAGLFANAGLARLQRGAALEGFSALGEAVRLAPEIDDIWRRLARSLTHTRVVPGDQGFRGVLLSLLQRPDIRPEAVATATVAALRADQDAAAALLLMRLAMADGASVDVQAPPLTALLRDPLLLALLESAPVPDEELELLLAGVRRALLLGAARDDWALHDKLGAAFVAALAQQCFLNEYVYEQSPEETRALAELRERSRPGPPASAKDWLAVATLACFEALTGAPAALDLEAAPPWLRPVLQQQVLEPAEEALLAADLAARAPAPASREAAATSQTAFPRWTRAFGGQPRPFDEAIRATLPHVSEQELPRTDEPRVLILGCRTGLAVIACLRAYANATIVGIDESLNNLAYARRKLQETDAAEVQFLWAGVSAPVALDGTFDLVQVPYLLLHADDLPAALANAAARVRPGGLLNLKLYSEASRQVVAQIHDLLELTGAQGSLEEIRGLRRDLILNPLASALDILRSPASDFWTASLCRELLFRRDERRYGLPEVCQALEATGLEFLGLELSHAPDVQRFASEHPGPDARRDPEVWRCFELDHPEAFGGTYRLWARRRLQRRASRGRRRGVPRPAAGASGA